MRDLFSKLVIVLLLGFGAFISCAEAQKPASTPPGIPRYMPKSGAQNDKELSTSPNTNTQNLKDIPAQKDDVQDGKDFATTRKTWDRKRIKDKGKNTASTKKNGSVNTQKLKDKPAQNSGPQNDKNMTVSPNVAVVVCGGSGRVTVRGWDKSEVRAVSEKGTRVNMIGARIGGDSTVISQVRVTITDEDSGEPFLGPCFSNSNLDLYVPRGAFVDLKTQEGDIIVEKVAKARLKSLNGNFSVREITKSVSAESTSGDILIESSSGQISVTAVSGSVDIRNVKSAETSDYLSATAFSGDVTLDRVNYLRVEGVSLSGDVTLFGALTKGAVYNLRTTSGDVTTAIPATSAFRVNATVSQGGEIICDFPITKPDAATPTRVTRLVGTHGTADSALNITAINGTIHLRKK